MGGEVDGQDVELGLECAGDAKRQLLVAGLQRPRGADRVLRAQRRDKLGAIDAKAGERVGGELDDDCFVLGTENLDLGHVGYAQQSCPDVLHIVAQLAVGEPVGREAVDDAEGIAELVVEAGPDDAGRQGMAHVSDALADMVPNVGHLARRRAALQVDEDRGRAGAGEAAQEIEARGFLERALDPLCHLIERFLDAPGQWRPAPPLSGTRMPDPRCAEAGIEAPATAARPQYTTKERCRSPFGKIELHQCGDPRWSSLTRCAPVPAVTTISRRP